MALNSVFTLIFAFLSVYICGAAVCRLRHPSKEMPVMHKVFMLISFAIGSFGFLEFVQQKQSDFLFIIVMATSISMIASRDYFELFYQIKDGKID